MVHAPESIDTGDGVEMTIQEDGTMDYVVIEGDRRQIVKLVCRTEGDEIVSNQPSAPREERTKYRFEGDKLVLTRANEETTFRRLP